MDDIESSVPDSNVSNGYVNKVFTVSLDMESETGIVQIRKSKDLKESLDLASFQNPVREKQELNRASKTTGIWRILHHRRTTSDHEGRPHSMILPGEASPSKLPFTDKVRGFKKLKSPSVFRGKSGKLASSKLHSARKTETNEDTRNASALLTCQRNLLRNKGKRHSYAGDVWNYLKRISFIGKGGSTLLEKSFDSMQTLDKTIDSDYGSVDVECIKDSMPVPKQTGPDVKSSHFRGLFRFFNSMAETARKWRNSSRPYSPPDGECPSNGSTRTQQN
ncbi:cdc42 guanine nucleotide exchange factor 9 isoform X6, partial [Silurus meridionalis]